MKKLAVQNSTYEVLKISFLTVLHSSSSHDTTIKELIINIINIMPITATRRTGLLTIDCKTAMFYNEQRITPYTDRRTNTLKYKNEWLMSREKVETVTCKEVRCAWEYMRMLVVSFYTSIQSVESRCAAVKIIVPHTWTANTFLRLLARSVFEETNQIISINISQGTSDINNILMEYCAVMDPVDLAQTNDYDRVVEGGDRFIQPDDPYERRFPVFYETITKNTI